MEERLGKKQVHTPHDQPDIDTLEQQELVDLQVQVALEMTRKHFYEREVMQ